MRLRARAGALIAAAVLLALAGVVASAAPARAERLLFVGDVLLARQVEEQVASRGGDPFVGVRELFRGADWVAGNLEGAVGERADCHEKLLASGTCFAVPAALLGRARDAGFAALVLENNHRADLGGAGRARTRAAVAEAGMLPLTFDGSPAFVRVGSLDVAVLALDRVPDIEGAVDALASVELARKLRLARALAPLTIVSVHWGRELVDWPDASQRAAAEWLVAHGADVIVGHHPHVVQPAECVDGRPVFFSLGNHLFDQKYPETRRGRIADCRVADGVLRCGAVATEAEPRSTAPRLVGPEEDVAAALAGCAVPLRDTLAVSGFTLAAEPTPVRADSGGVALRGAQGEHRWRTRPVPVLSVERLAPEQGGELLFALEAHFSPLDGQVAPRPYVYSVSARGLTARWRGSGLAWPLADAIVLPSGLVCALHEGGSFVAGDAAEPAAHAPGPLASRVALYRWNGFGFSAAENASANAACAAAFGVSSGERPRDLALPGSG